MEQVALQLIPFSEKLAWLKTHVTKLWGNGTGPPGYLETARAEDKVRYDELKQQNKEMTEKLDRLAETDTFEAGSQDGADRRKKDWRATITIVIAFLMFVIGVVSLILSVRIKVGNMEIPEITPRQSQTQEYSAREALPQAATSHPRY